MLKVRKSQDRGGADFGWLKSKHTFSFGSYYDPEHHHFRSLRVINEDWVAGGEGFDPHPHRDMEILTYILSGELEHKDSMGNGSIIRPGDVQRMTAGTGVVHSEFNARKDQEVHLLQIWILPDTRGLEPSYEQKSFPMESRRNQLRIVASPDAADGSVRIHQDAKVSLACLDGGRELRTSIGPGRHLWVQVARGRIRVNTEWLDAGDGAALSDETQLLLQAGEDGAEALVFDMN